MKLSLDMQPISLTQILWLMLAAIYLLLAGSLWYYHGAYKTKSETLKTLQQSVAIQNKEADAKLKQLTEDRDKAQKLLDDQAKAQGIKDAQAQTNITALHTKLLNTPIRVQYVSSTASHRSAAGDQAAITVDSAANQAAGSGVLPEENTRRLADALSEVETLSAAYNSCRSSLIQP